MTTVRAKKKSCIVKSIVKLKHMTSDEIEWYTKFGDGANKVVGYDIQGSIQAFITFVSGSVSNIMGLPMLELRNMMLALGYRFDQN